MKKNKLIIALLLVLLFIPTYIAITNYVLVNNTPITVETATKIIIKDIAGKTYNVDAKSDAAVLIKEMRENATPIGALPDKLMDADAFIISSINGNRATDERYYFSLDVNSVYCLDSKGQTYAVKPEHAQRFLETEYAQSLYGHAYLPTLQNGDNVIAPTENVWVYENISSNQLQSFLTDNVKAGQTYTSENGLSFSSSREPDFFEVEIKDENGNILYEKGDYASIPENIAKENPVLYIDAEVKWECPAEMIGTGEASGGEAKYSFVLNIKAQPEFEIAFSGAGDDYEEFIPGDIAFVSALGITAPEKIEFSSEPALMHDGKEIAPVFFVEGENSYAFLPTAYDTAPGKYVLTFTYNNVAHTEEMTIAEKTFKTGSDLEISVARVKATFTEETRKAYDDMVATVLSESDFTVRHFDNTAFSEPYSKRTGISGYARPRTTSTTREKYVNKGIDFNLKNTEDILAIMDGEIIYTGTTAYAGTAVAIDHGYGLVSWYHHLGGVKVNKGDVVKKGDVIADNIVDEGFTNGKMLHLRLTVFDVPVSAYDLLWSDADGDKTYDTGISFK